MNNYGILNIRFYNFYASVKALFSWTEYVYLAL